MGRAPPRLKNHFGAMSFERESKRAATASNSAANGPEYVATGPCAQAHTKMPASEKTCKRAACAPLPRASHPEAHPSRHEPVGSGSRTAALQKKNRRHEF